jgi:thiol-disulfide isomerase/thioredoxin
VRRAIAALLLVSVVCALAAGCGAAGLGDDAPPPPTIGAADRSVAPVFSVPRLAGPGQVRLAALRGQPVLLNFWASWCAPCKRETPALVAFSRAHPDIRVVGLAVNDAPSDSRGFARRYDIPYTLGIDRSGAVGERYGIPGLPSSIAIDAQGRVVTSWPGPLSAKDLDNVAARLTP